MGFTKGALKAFASAAVVAVLPGMALAQDFVMKISAPIPPTEKDVVYDWMLHFEKAVEARSDGRIDVQLFPANQLGQLPAAIEGVSMGTIEAAFSIIGFFSSLDPRFQVLDAGGLFDTPDAAMRALQQPAVREMLSQFGSAAGVRPLAVLIDGQGVIISRDPIETVADFNGLKVRSGGATPLLNEPLVAVGASPVALPLGEVVPALQTGSIDAATNSMAVVNAFKMADVAKNVTYIPGNYVVTGSIISTTFLDTVGPDLAAIIMEEAQRAESVVFKHLEMVPAQEAAWAASGGQVIRFSDEEKAGYLETIEPVVEKVVAQNPQMQSDYDVLKSAAAAVR